MHELDTIFPRWYERDVIEAGAEARASDAANLPAATHDRAQIVRHFLEKAKPLAALCHGSLILAAAGVLNGKKIATYEALAPDMEKAGAEFQNREVMVDGNLISSRTWMDLPFFMREFLKVLGSSQPKPVAARA